MNGSSVEIERKFLVRRAPSGLDKLSNRAIEQGYLAASGTEELRIRRRGDHHTLTLKSGSGRVRTEEEIELSGSLFEQLWPLTEARRIHKTRYEIPHGDWTIELDEYGGDLSGLLVAEVEFVSSEDANNFRPPSWFDREVTEDPAFKNRALAESSTLGDLLSTLGE